MQERYGSDTLKWCRYRFFVTQAVYHRKKTEYAYIVQITSKYLSQ